MLTVYNPNYPDIYKKEVEILKQVLQKRNAKFYHIGSTAIPSILSKPIVDIAIELPSFPMMEDDIDKISNLGYRYWKDNPIREHQFFFKNLPRTHHLHFYPVGYQKLADQIRFRDMLNSSIQSRKEYEKLKIRLAEKYRFDREKYTSEKGQFIRKILTSK